MEFMRRLPMRTIVVFVLLSLLLTGCGRKPSGQQTPAIGESKEGTEIHILSLGKADCILILSDGEAALIDAGYAEQGTQIVEYLKKQGVTRLKYLVATHGDKDHIGGIPAVLKAFSVGEMLLSPKREESSEYRAMVTAMNSAGVSYCFAEPGQKLSVGKGSLTVLAPGTKALSEGSDNESSVVLHYTYGERSALFMGDALTKSEKELRDSGYVLKADILKVGHHGKADATQKKTVKLIAPSYAVITCGEVVGDDEPGMPDDEVLRLLNSFSVQILRTDVKGTCVFSTKGDVWTLQTER